MWNAVLDKKAKDKRKADCEKYRPRLKHAIKLLTEVLESNNEVLIIAYGRCFEKAFGKEEKE